MTEQMSEKRSSVKPVLYSEWGIRKFDYIGLEVLLPSEAKTSPSVSGPASLSISMHFVSAQGVLDDATVFVRIYVKRIPTSELREDMEYQLAGRSQESQKYWQWYFQIHPMTSEYTKGGYSYFRRDVTLDRGEILHIYAEVLNAGPDASQDADHVATKQIIDSISPLR